MNIGERIKRRRKQLKYSADKLGALIGKDRATVYRYEKNEIENMSIALIEPLAKALNVTPAYLMGWEDVEPFQLTSEYQFIPHKISAGLPLEVEYTEMCETITIPDELLGKYAGNKNIFFMRVNGDSMNKIFPHNSLIAVKKTEVSDVKNGDIVVYSNSYEYSVKKFFDVGDQLVFRPESTNPAFTDHILNKSNENLRLHGKVVTYIVNLD